MRKYSLGLITGDCYSIILYPAQLSIKNQIKLLSSIQEFIILSPTHLLRKITGVLHENEKINQEREEIIAEQ